MDQKGIWITLAMLLVATACDGRIRNRGPEGAELAEIQQESLDLDTSLDDLEARILVANGRVAAWTELKDRHQSVSQIACRNLGEHVEGIARFVSNQKVKRRRKRVQSVAQAEVDLR